MSLFLSQDEVRELTGYTIKAKQIDQLRRMGIPFLVNGAGRPVVTTAAVEGRKQQVPQTQGWSPAILTGGRKAA